LELLGELPVVVEAATGIDDADALIGLGREHTLSAYDATYLRLAMRERIPLATKDAALRMATRAAGVPLLGVK
ncbi:MAG: type II toxin-antitoxin system VapC family toxin, partial [Candidatus Rokubacteria bacterium]|nr:type II toxin-antitoxin system VapC family toxin [Candidatus Rokubacteria bacterium]